MTTGLVIYKIHMIRLEQLNALVSFHMFRWLNRYQYTVAPRRRSFLFQVVLVAKGNKFIGWKKINFRFFPLLEGFTVGLKQLVEFF